MIIRSRNNMMQWCNEETVDTKDYEHYRIRHQFIHILDTFQNDKHLSIGIALADNPVKFTQIYTLYNAEKKVLK
jgi:hypothetical protein